MKTAVEILSPSEWESTRKHSAFTWTEKGKGFGFFSLANISENHLIR
jgi:hypothetical protein